MAFKDLVEGVKSKVRLSSKAMPAHVAFAVEGFTQESIQTSVEKVRTIASAAVKLQIPMITFHLSGAKIDSRQLDLVEALFASMKDWQELQQNQTKVNVVGRWFQLPERIIEQIKPVLDATKDYDRNFLNFCIIYDGQEEIADAAKLIAKQAKLGRIDPEAIDKAVLKEHLYTSYFIPPDIIIKTGKSKRLGGVLLWDSAHSKVFFAEKEWNDFTQEDFLKAVEWWQSS